MKLKNAPERKRIRQLGALERLKSILRPNMAQEWEIAVLEKRTLWDLRDIRTKKERSMG